MVSYKLSSGWIKVVIEDDDNDPQYKLVKYFTKDDMCITHILILNIQVAPNCSNRIRLAVPDDN